MRPDASIIIVSYNTRDILCRCLQSVEDAATGFQVQTIVVDNASTDGTLEMLRDEFPWVEVIANRSNPGFAMANNQGLAVALGDITLLLNSDAFLTSDALRAGLATLHGQPDVGIAGVRLVNEDGSFQAAEARFPTLWHDIACSVGFDRLFISRRTLRSEPGAVDWVQGACMFVRRAAVDDAGGLDTGFFMYSEEVEWCWRIHRHGWEVWQLPDIAVVHLGGASSTTNDISRRIALYRSRLALRRRLGGRAASISLWVSMIGGLAGRIALRGLTAMILRRQPGQQSVHSDIELLRSLLRVNPLSSQAT